ncbi:AAA family ATPase [Fodinisporobacter ferrooxydans]|uniref:AAA family ATPase n=1 Tax=Fodinisporobacter ferrooxydans TaxID=2901836 RepID=A0ABY4CKR7_9BACL|nr:AAA family ATPase [Alicyclobacillaceae bacterium MYW30-H2]
MRIKHLHIYGFGQLKQMTIDVSPQGLHIIYGPNESGKTTLLACIRAILFGFDSSKTKSRYEPMDGGKFGGKIICQIGENGKHSQTLQIERVFQGRALRGDLKITDDSGRIYTEERYMQEFQKHLSPQVYQSIYAFGLSELEDFQSLSKEDIQGRIHSAGMGLGAVSPIEIEKKLENRKLSLYRKRGQDQPLTKLVKEKQELRKSMQQLSTIPEQYEKLRQELAEVHGKMEQWRTAKQKLEQRRNQANVFAQLRQLWEEIHPIQQRLLGLQHLPVCTRDMYHQWDKWQERLNGLEEKMQEYERQYRILEEETNGIHFDPDLEEDWNTIVELHQERHVYMEWVNQIEKLSTELEHIKIKQDGILAQLGVNSNANGVFSISTTFVTYEEVRKFEADRSQITEQLAFQTSQVGQLQKERILLEEDMKDLASAIQEIAANFHAEPDQLLQLQNTIQQLQDLAMELQPMLAQKKWFEQQESQWKQQESPIQSLRSERKSSGQEKGTRLFFTGVVLIVTILLAAGVAWPALRIGLFAGAICVLLFAGFTLQVVKEQQGRNGSNYKGNNREARSIGQSLANVQENIEQLARQLDPLMQKIRVLAEEIRIDLDGLRVGSVDSSQEAFQRFVQFLLQKRTQVERLLILVAQRQDCLRKQEKNERRLLEEVQKQKQLQESLHQWEHAWHVWLTTQGIAHRLSPASVLQYLQLVERGKENLREFENRSKQKLQYESQIRQFIQKIIDLQQQFQKEEHPDIVYPKDPLHRLQDLYNQAKRNHAACVQKQELEYSCQTLNNQRVQIWQELQHHLQEMNGWLKKHGFSEPGQIADSYENTEKKRQLEEQLHMLYLKCEAISGSRHKYEQQLPQILEQDSSSWLHLLQELERELEQIQEELAECSRLQGRLESEIERLEIDSERSRLQQQMQQIDAQLNDLAREWSVYTLTQKLLELARQKYEQDRQPAVLQKASRMFGDITNNRYQQVRTRIGAPDILAIQSQTIALSTSSLSRGTAEQLYLSLRFALIDELYQKGMEAPIILDDIFVNFDPMRLQTTIQVLDRMAQQHQILFLTCHPYVAESLQANIQPSHYTEFFPQKQEFTIEK